MALIYADGTMDTLREHDQQNAYIIEMLLLHAGYLVFDWSLTHCCKDQLADCSMPVQQGNMLLASTSRG